MAYQDQEKKGSERKNQPGTQSGQGQEKQQPGQQPSTSGNRELSEDQENIGRQDIGNKGQQPRKDQGSEDQSQQGSREDQSRRDQDADQPGKSQKVTNQDTSTTNRGSEESLDENSPNRGSDM